MEPSAGDDIPEKTVKAGDFSIRGERPLKYITNSGNWYPQNLQAIDSVLDSLNTNDRFPTPVAIFDFDNTCIYRDVGKAVFRYQLFSLRYKISPDSLMTILPTTPKQIDGIPLADIINQLISDYRSLWPYIKAGDKIQAQSLPEYKQFTTLMLWFAHAARQNDELGAGYALPLLTKLLAGHSVEEVHQLTRDTLAEVMAEPLEEVSCAFDFKGSIGRVEASYQLGLQVHEEMQQLMGDLQQVNIACYVVSASTEWIVQAAAPELAFPVPVTNIFGVRIQLSPEGLLTTWDPEHYPVTYRQGKAQVIDQHIQGNPVLIAGDADTDYEMLTLPDVPLRLIINRNQEGLISSLYQDSRFLLQGLDITHGLFRPSRKTTAVELP